MWGIALVALAVANAGTQVFASRSPSHHSDEPHAGAKSDARNALKHLGHSATPFCSSLLGITATTTIVTVVVSTVTVTDTGCVASDVVKLKVRTQGPSGGFPVPPGLASFPKGVVSEVCSELGLSPAYTTTTKTMHDQAVITVQAVAVTTVCQGCTPPGSPCDITDPGQCCNEACMTSIGGTDPSYTCL